MSIAIRGRLVSRQFAQLLPNRYAGRLGEDHRAAAARRIARWHASITRTLGPASGLLAIQDVAAVPLARVLGFDVRPAGHRDGGRAFVSRVDTRAGAVAMLVVSRWTERLDRHAGLAVREAIACGVRWAICTNGRQVRLVDASRPHSRPYIEFELDTTVADPAALALFWGLLRAPALGPSRQAGAALTADVAAHSAAHGRAVAHGLQDGVRDALALLARALGRNVRRRSTASGTTVVGEALTIVFRLLFLLFAEARALVPMWHPVYRTSYAVHGMRLLADREDPERLWDGLQAIVRLAHDGCTLDDLHVTAFNGRLFAPEHTPLERRASIDNPTIRQVLRSLTDVADGGGTVHSVAYADLDVEQLGSIYERLLDAAPVLERDLDAPARAARAPSRDRRGTGHGRDAPPARPRGRARISGRRKESGTFYTPRPLAEHLVRDTLEPLVRGRTPEEILQLRVLDPAMGSGAFLVAACRYLGDAYARVLEESGEVDTFDRVAVHRAACRRLVAQRCLYGVDVNPVATGLARLSLWLATLAADVPLTFLDHHLRTGDSLAGTSLDAVARGWSAAPVRVSRPRSGTPTLPFGSDELTGMLRGLLPLREQLAAPDERVELVREKERLLGASLQDGAPARWLTLADIWCARWWWPAGAPRLPPSAWGEIADSVLHDRTTLPRAVVERWKGTARAVASARRFLHWPLHFPEVFFDAHGLPRPDAGFDAIVGNPPWDMVRDDAREGAERVERGPETSGLMRFARESGLYTRAPGGHLNRYQLFVERSLTLLRPGGRLGLVLPWGLAADQASSTLRRQLLESCDTDRIIAFENGEAIFPIHRSVRFVLLTATTGRPTPAIGCRIGERSLAALERTGEEDPPAARPLTLTPAFLRRVSGEGLALPWLRTREDAVLLDRLHGRWPALGDPDGWHAAFSRELNASDDRSLFEAGDGGLRVVQGRHIQPFRVDLSLSTGRVRASAAATVRRRVPGTAHARVAYRDVASAGNRLTLIAALLPPDTVSTHTVFCLRTRMPVALQWTLCALLNSFVANYLVRLRVTTHVTTQIVHALPVPPARPETPWFDGLVRSARALAAGAPPDGPEYVRVQSLSAIAYGLEVDELAYVLGTFPLVDVDVRRAVLGDFRALESRPAVYARDSRNGE